MLDYFVQVPLYVLGIVLTQTCTHGRSASLQHVGWVERIDTCPYLRHEGFSTQNHLLYND